MHRVFVSSTVQDLRRHRKAVFDSIDQLGATVVAMEKFGARDERPKEECLRIIREETDVFVGIYAHRYGFIPKGDVLSITQLEYEQAIRAKVPTFVYLVDPSHRWPLAHIDTGGSADKLSEFVERLQDDRICSQFTTPNYLAAEVAADLGRYFSGDPRKALVRHGLIHRPRRAWVSGARRSRQQFKVVVFDLDGTLLRGNGFEFSWEAIWNALGFATATQSKLKRDYRRRTGDSGSSEERIAAYQDWCDKACEMFRARGLTRVQLQTLAEPLQLTRNCREALAELRKAGIAIAIVSGGVNTFLEDRFPDFRDFVDFVFINELTFCDDGTLEGVLATAYDFQGKSDALDLVCLRVGCAPDEAVFVGDRFNDEAVLLSAGLGIAYPPNDDQARDAAEVIVQDDDLLKILPHILRA